MSEQPPRPEWVRYRLAKDEIVLTFRVPKGTPMVMEQAGWDVEGAVIEAEAGATPAVSLDRAALAIDLLEALSALDGSKDVALDVTRPAIARNHLRAALARLSADEEGTDAS